MSASVALRQRGQFALLLRTILQQARSLPTWQEPDRRNLRLWRALILAVLVQRSTRLLVLARALRAIRRAHSVKSLAQGLSYFFTAAKCPVATLSPLLLRAALATLDPTRLVRYRGHLLLVIDGTDYPKRSRGLGTADRQMQYIGRVRANKGKTKAKEASTTPGYVDLWAGVVLKGKRFLPLARRLYSSAHPDVASQNQVEEAVLEAARAQLQCLGHSCIVVGDRGFGRKALLIRLANAGQPFVLRLDPDITVHRFYEDADFQLAALLAEQPWLGEVVWQRGERGRLVCRARKVRGTISYTTGRKVDTVTASMTFVQLVPLDGRVAPLVVATTLPVHSRVDAQGIAQVYAQRWAVETAFETMKSWGLGRFMVRQWGAIDRLVWSVAVAYAVATLALYLPTVRRFRVHAEQVLRAWGVVGRGLSAGKVAEALGLDFQRHRRAWFAAWLC